MTIEHPKCYNKPFQLIIIKAYANNVLFKHIIVISEGHVLFIHSMLEQKRAPSTQVSAKQVFGRIEKL